MLSEEGGTDKRDTKRKPENIDEEKLSTKYRCMNIKLNQNFYNIPCEILAKSLLGKILARKLNDVVLRGRIIETECYLGGVDKASHSYNGRRTKCNEPMFMKPGTAYVYKIYGIYHCFNISSIGDGAAVLLRALDPIDGLEYMHECRQTGKQKRKLKHHELCNGPSKLCISLCITKEICNKLDLCNNEHLWIEDDKFEKHDLDIVTSSRIGIESAGDEWANKPLRFYILGNPSVSKRDKIVEQLILDKS